MIRNGILERPAGYSAEGGENKVANIFYDSPVTKYLTLFMIIICSMSAIDPAFKFNITYLSRLGFANAFVRNFVHFELWHILTNLLAFSSFIRVEKDIGSLNYFNLLMLLTVAISGIDCLYEFVAKTGVVAIGFSAVLFALDIIYPVPIASSLSPRIFVFVKLILIHYTIPQSSFVGHLIGIIVGFLYIGLFRPV